MPGGLRAVFHIAHDGVHAEGIAPLQQQYQPARLLSGFAVGRLAFCGNRPWHLFCCQTLGNGQWRWCRLEERPLVPGHAESCAEQAGVVRTHGRTDAERLAGGCHADDRFVEPAHDGVGLRTESLCLVFCLLKGIAVEYGAVQQSDRVIACLLQGIAHFRSFSNVVSLKPPASIEVESFRIITLYVFAIKPVNVAGQMTLANNLHSRIVAF